NRGRQLIGIGGRDYLGTRGDIISDSGGGFPRNHHITLASFAILCVTDARAAPNTLLIINQCTVPVWIQQQQLPGAPAIVRIAAGGRYTYTIPLNGPRSTRFWPKTGCDAAGNNCAVGQSSPPCPSKGCAPPVDSKLEVSWGCLAAPCSGKNNETFFNLSQVDGFTLPYSVAATGAGNNCKGAACITMNYATQCPKSEDLSSLNNFPSLKDQNLSVTAPVTKQAIGCFSPCGKLSFATSFGSYQLPTNNPNTGYYCCQTINGKNPIPALNPGTADGCRAGPAPKTKYVKFVDSACGNQVYGYAYDDAHGIKNCIGTTRLVFTLCPLGFDSGPRP
ncbi:MAG: hypothetical protein L0Y50_03440, partial [Beijerinckiaceae bacterium]|nr:hypothetical protein [Beijerinckiaceae bacterium]